MIFAVVDLSELPGTIFDTAALTDFWQYVKWITYFLMPIIIIGAAVLLSDRFMDMVLGIFGLTSKDDKKDDDYDVEYY